MENIPDKNITDEAQAEAGELNIVEAKIGEHVKKRRRRSSDSGSKRKKHRRSSYKKNGKKKMKLWKKALIALGAVVLSLALIVTGTLLYLRGTGRQQFNESSYTITAPESPDVRIKDNGNTVNYKGKNYKYKDYCTNMLFMGIDKKEYEEEKTEIGNKYQSDVIIVISVDAKNNKVTLVNVPRDIITDVSVYSKTGGYTGIEKLPIALSYAYGSTDKESCLNCLDSVRRIFYNIPIKAFFSMEISGIAVVNDEIGGVDVKSPEDVYKGDNNLIFEKGKKYHLEGTDARNFVMSRSHETPNANLLRNERQKIYLTEFMKKTISQTKSDFSTPVRLYNAAEDYSCTNITLNGVTFLATELLGKGENLKTDTKTIPVDVKANGSYAENYIRDGEFYEMFLNVFYDEVK